MCGGRGYGVPPMDATPEDVSRAALEAAHLIAVLDLYEIVELCHGAARGADTVAGRYATQRGIPCQEFPADWRTFGPSAGHRRNQRMLDSFKPDLVIAFPGGKGTANMCLRAAAANVKVVPA